MNPWSLAKIADVVGGAVHGDPTRTVTSVVSDSRDCVAGSMFVAIAGERVDGHDFVPVARERGAIAVLAERPTEITTIVVPDPVAALGELARVYRNGLPNVRVLALTGSSGKTTTKDLLADVLRPHGPTVAPRGSFNSEVGLPLTILECTDDTRYLVLEMGMRGHGHIAQLCTIGRPDVAALINVGSAHLGMLGSREAIAQAKGEILDGDISTAVLNADDPVVLEQAVRTTATVVTFGESPQADVRVSDVRIDDQARPSFRLRIKGIDTRVDLRLRGEHQVSNAAAAAAMAAAVGIPPADIAAALSAAEPRSRWRMEVVETPEGITLINDAYNANPESMRAALKTLVVMGRSRRTWAVLGEMRELGDSSREEHDALGRLAVRLDVARLVVVGEGARALHLGASLEGSWGNESMWVPDVDSAIDLLRNEVRSGDVVLVKASRSVGLERVAESLLEGPAS